MKTTLGMDVSGSGFVKGLQGLQPQIKNIAFLAKAFGKENVNAAIGLIENASVVEEMTAKVTGTNVAITQAAVRTNTYTHKTKVLGAQFDDLKISIFNATQGIMPWVAGIGSGLMVSGQAAMGSPPCREYWGRLTSYTYTSTQNP